MVRQYKTIYVDGTAEIVEKKSRFLANISHVESEEEAIRFIEECKKKYWNATHNCWAYVIGKRGELMRCSDDGEPSQTAGKPMLDVLNGQEIRDVVAVVTRYFGGTLLGTGGLVRAYSGAVKEGLGNAVVVEKKRADLFQIVTDYAGIGKIQYLLAQESFQPIDTDYAADVTVTVPIPVEESGRIQKRLIEGTNGRAKVEVSDQLYYAVVEGERILFPE